MCSRFHQERTTKMMNKKEIIAELEKIGKFSVASLQRGFSLSYPQARELASELERQKKATMSEDGLTYIYQSALQKAQEPKRSAFDRFLHSTRMSPEEQAVEEERLLEKIYESFGGRFSREGDAYVFEMPSAECEHHRIYLDFVDGKFRIHEGGIINEEYREELGLDTPEGVLIMNRVMKKYLRLFSLDDGVIGYSSVSCGIVVNVIQELYDLLEFLAKHGDSNGNLITASLIKAYKSVDEALGYLIAQNPLASKKELLEIIDSRREKKDYLEDDEGDGYDVVRGYLAEMVEHEFIATASLITKNRRPRYFYKPKSE